MCTESSNIVQHTWASVMQTGFNIFIAPHGVTWLTTEGWRGIRATSYTVSRARPARRGARTPRSPVTIITIHRLNCKEKNSIFF